MGWGGGGGVGFSVQKKYSRRVKLNEKNACTPINPKIKNKNTNENVSL